MNKAYLWEVSTLQLLKNQLLTGYKMIREGKQVSFVPLTEEEKLLITQKINQDETNYIS